MTVKKEISKEILRKYFQDRFKVFSEEIKKLKGCEEKLVIQNLIIKDYEDYLFMTDFIKYLLPKLGRPENEYLNNTYIVSFLQLEREHQRFPNNKEFCERVKQILELSDDDFEDKYRKNVERKFQEYKNLLINDR